jgi:hypothetical protein
LPWLPVRSERLFSKVASQRVDHSQWTIVVASLIKSHRALRRRDDSCIHLSEGIKSVP